MSEIVKIDNKKIKLSTKVEGKTWEEAKEKAFNKLSANLEIKGFRKGQAPKNIAKKHINENSLLMEACDLVLQEALTNGIKEHDLELLARPSVNVKSISVEAVELEFELVCKPEVELKEYKNLGYKVTNPRVNEEEIKKEIERKLDENASLVLKEDGAIENGDTAIIDFEGFKDGEAFEGGKASNHPLVIGSGSFIPGFEEQLLGLKTGAEKDLDLTFPEDYPAENLKGAKVVFKVKVNEIKTKKIPTLDDEFVKDLELKDVNNVEDYKAYLKNEIRNRKKAEAENKATRELEDKLMEKNPIDLPNEIIDNEIDYMLYEQDSRMRQSGLSLEQYLQFTNSTIEKYRESLKETAIKRSSIRLLLEAIAKKEELVVSEEDLNKALEDMAKSYNLTADKVRESIKLDDLKYGILLGKAMDFVKNN